MAAAITTSVKIEGTAELRRILDLLPKEIRQTVLTHAVKTATKPMEAAAKRFAPRRTGALRNSITTVVRNYPSTGNVVAVVGPARGYFQRGRRVRKGGSLAGAESPSHYAHLVEFGHAVRQPKKGRTIRKGTALLPGDGKVTIVPPRPFMRPAFMATKGTAGRTLLEGAAAGIQKARDQLVRKYGHKS